MAQWYVKELSTITGVSVQTLHHYDRIDLLKPSLRLPNGYRVYSEKDLLRLQQIIALKYFGFELSQINGLLAGKMSVHEHFRVQAQFLQKKAKTLLEASQNLEELLSDCDQNESIPWKTIIQLIEVYKMTQQLEQSWAANVFTPEELKQYAEFESGLKTRFTSEEKNDFEKNWGSLVEQIKNNLDQDPRGPFGLGMAKKVMDLINGLYGREHANIKHAIWHKGFKKGQVDKEHLLSPEIVAWLDQANDAYYRGRIYAMLDQVGKVDDKTLRVQWNDFMDEMYGKATEPKQALIDAAMTDPHVSKAAREWLK